MKLPLSGIAICRNCKRGIFFAGNRWEHKLTEENNLCKQAWPITKMEELKL